MSSATFFAWSHNRLAQTLYKGRASNVFRAFAQIAPQWEPSWCLDPFRSSGLIRGSPKHNWIKEGRCKEEVRKVEGAGARVWFPALEINSRIRRLIR